MKKRKNFYGKWIVLGSFIITVFTMAIVNNTTSFYMTPICESLGFSTGQFSGSYSMAAIGAAVGALLAGALVDKLPLRVLMAIGAAGTGLCFVGMSFATQLWQFYVLLLFLDMFMAQITNVPLTTMLNNWYVDKRGTVTGLVFAGAGLGGIFFSPLTESFIKNLGWETAAILAGVIILITAVPVCVFIFYKMPADIGQEPFVYPEGSPEALKAAAKAREEHSEKAGSDANAGVPKKMAMHSSAFVLLAVGLFCMGMVSAGVMVHIPNFLYDMKMNAGFVMSVLSVGMLLGTFASGVVIDKLGMIKALMMSTILFALGMVCLYFTGKAPTLAYVMAVLVGFSVCISAVGPPMLTSVIFGMKDYSALYGLNYALFLVGCVAGPVSCGIIYDASSSYSTVWLIYIVIAAAMFVFSAMAVKAGAALRKKAGEAQ